MREFKPKTPLGKKLLETRQRAIDLGMELKTIDELLDEKDATIARLTKENDSLKGEVERLEKELRILYSSNADMFASVEQAEKELAKYKAFWEYSREADKLTWLHYHWERK